MAEIRRSPCCSWGTAWHSVHFPTTEARIIALTLLVYWVGDNILDLGSGLVNVLLPIGLVFYLSLLPGSSLLHRGSFFYWFKLAFVLVISGPVVQYELVFSFRNESFIHQSLEVWKIEHDESSPELRV